MDRSLYGSRAYASKNPALSPITESLFFIDLSPEPPQSPSRTHAGKTRAALAELLVLAAHIVSKPLTIHDRAVYGEKVLQMYSCTFN